MCHKSLWFLWWSKNVFSIKNQFVVTVKAKTPLKGKSVILYLIAIHQDWQKLPQWDKPFGKNRSSRAISEQNLFLSFDFRSKNKNHLCFGSAAKRVSAKDNDIPMWRQPGAPDRERGPKHGFSAWRCLFWPYARQPTGNARNARLLLDRRPCSTYWLPVGRATGTVSKMSSHTIGTRHLWLCGRRENERFTLRTLVLLVLPLARRRSGCPGLTFLDGVWKVEEKVSPNPTRLSHLGWFKWHIITFSQPVSLYWYSAHMMHLIIIATLIRRESAEPVACKHYWWLPRQPL